MDIVLRIGYVLVDLLLFPIVYHIVRYRRKIVRKNLRLSFADKPQSEIKQIERDFYRHFCDTIVEALCGYGMDEQQMREHVVFENADEVKRQALGAGGIIIMMAHMGNWEWMASFQEWIKPEITELNVYRQLKSKAADRLMLKIRHKRGGVCVEKKRILREMIRYRSEKRPIVVGLICDQKPRPEVTRTWTEFLHQETGWLDGGEVLAKKFDYPVFGLQVTKTSRGHYRAQFVEIATDPKVTEEGYITRTYAHLLEENIKSEPEIWLWSHNRWKWGKR